MWLLLSARDQTNVRANEKRQFPFSTIVTDKELYFRVYGKSLKTAAPKFAAAIAVPATFVASQSLNGITEAVSPATTPTFALEAAVYTNKGHEASSSTGGLIEFKFAQATWGGICCTANTAASCTACDLATGHIKLFSTPSTNVISHSYYDTSNDKHNAITQIEITAMMDLPATLTTVRGRGGLTASNQQLVDVFWSMTSNVASTMSIQALLHFYVYPTTANTKTDA